MDEADGGRTAHGREACTKTKEAKARNCTKTNVAERRKLHENAGSKKRTASKGQARDKRRTSKGQAKDKRGDKPACPKNAPEKYGGKNFKLNVPMK
jgi:hypothetical protein